MNYVKIGEVEASHTLFTDINKMYPYFPHLFPSSVETGVRCLASFVNTSEKAVISLWQLTTLRIRLVYTDTVKHVKFGMRRTPSGVAVLCH
jgi:hypothetical protein